MKLRSRNMSTPARRRVESLIKGLDRVAVAYSGGIDSTLVLRLAHEPPHHWFLEGIYE